MKPHYVLLAALATSSLLAIAGPPEKLPAAWTVSGPSPQKFSSGVETSDVGGVRGAKFLRNKSEDAQAWGALTQQISAQRYLGQRLQFKARIKTADIGNYAGLWMRVDTPAKHGAAFYNSVDKPIRGSTDWQERTVTLDVPADASIVSFGVIGSGKGQVWIDALTLEPVGRDVPVDRMSARQRPLPDKPTL
ncbi:transcriptional regulator [Massilia sp. IC2-278]|uniref:transcriptional regulator n=1 Tax=Massilia sp. IC2-278 TaxID=2887200 RepID=UPI001E5F82C3|nr:transcriptional regulator [Massilia sp. IC2-278]MCC2961031.1 transcriptional regulator [Massilia sp. IC2-278]